MILVVQESSTSEKNSNRYEGTPITIWNEKKEEQEEISLPNYRLQNQIY